MKKTYENHGYFQQFVGCPKTRFTGQPRIQHHFHLQLQGRSFLRATGFREDIDFFTYKNGNLK